MPKPIPTPYSTILPPTKAEQEAVHEVYEAIAPHFSLTRYKPWPLVSQFLSSLPPHTFGLDSGGGNGKYSPLGVNGGAGGREVVVLDMSWGLLSVARDSRSVPASTSTTTTGSTTEGEGKRDGGKIECMRGELGYNGWRDRVFDWAISIAAIHHLSTPLRRTQATQALLDALVLQDKNGLEYSRFMIYVWAYEQGEGSKRKMGKRAQAQNARSLEEPPSEHIPGNEQGGKEIVQDVLVPWVLQPKPGTKLSKEEEDPSPQPQVFNRYYHLFVKGELRQLVESAAQSGGYTLSLEGESGSFGQNEKWVRIKAEGWEADNWWLEGQVGIGPRED